MSDSSALWAVSHQAPLSLEFSREEFQNGLQFPSAEDLPDPGIKPATPASAGKFFTAEPQGSPLGIIEEY